MPRRRQVQELDTNALEHMVNQRWPGAMMRASDPSLAIERLPTGILSIDLLLSGGFARGRHIEIFGGFGVGKTYTSYKLIASAQQAGGRCAFIDVEGTFDPAFAELCGVDNEALDFHQQEHGNRVIDFMETLLRSRLYDVVVLDSIAALLPKQELEQDMEASTMGTAQAKLMSAALRRLTAANRRTVLVYINQTRDAVGTVFGKRQITSGGRAMAFYAGTRLEMVRTENIKRKGKQLDPEKGEYVDRDIVKGHRVLVRVDKDKTGSSHQHATTSFVFDYELGGHDPVEDLIYVGREAGLVHKSGNSWWVEGYEDEKQASRGKFKSWMKRNAAVAEELEEQLRNQQEDQDG